MRNYVTFGQIHVHSINGKTFDKDCVATYSSQTPQEGRQRAFDLFGEKFCFHYVADPPDLSFFPRGFMSVDEAEANV